MAAATLTPTNYTRVSYHGGTTEAAPASAGNTPEGLTIETDWESQMAVTKRTRFEVLRRDNYTCRYCRSEDGALTVDHVTPTALGGGDGPDNLVAACKDCNVGKSSTSPDERTVTDVSDDELEWASNLRAALMEYDKGIDEKWLHRDDFLRQWNQWTTPDGSTVELPPNWEGSVDQWMALGVRIGTLNEAIRIAMTKSGLQPGEEFRYLAGVVWKIVREAGGL